MPAISRSTSCSAVARGRGLCGESPASHGPSATSVAFRVGVLINSSAVARVAAPDHHVLEVDTGAHHLDQDVPGPTPGTSTRVDRAIAWVVVAGAGSVRGGSVVDRCATQRCGVDVPDLVDALGELPAVGGAPVAIVVDRVVQMGSAVAEPDQLADVARDPMRCRRRSGHCRGGCSGQRVPSMTLGRPPGTSIAGVPPPPGRRRGFAPRRHR